MSGLSVVDEHGNITFDFGDALERLKEGLRVARWGWNGKDMWIQIQYPDAHSKMTLPYIYMRTAQGDLVPWLASQTDILSADWVAVIGEEPKDRANAHEKDDGALLLTEEVGSGQRPGDE